jgi:drug/metabolite transporter (DMT)-like permease
MTRTRLGVKTVGGTPELQASSDRAHRARRWLALLTIDVVWGSTYLAMAVGIDTMPPFAMAATRYTLAGAIVASWAGLGPIVTLAKRPRAWRHAILIGILMAGVGNGLVAWSQEEVPSGWAALIVSLAPAWTALLAWARFGERPRPTTSVGIALGVLGVALLTGSHGESQVPDIGHLAAVLIAPAGWAAGSLFAQRIADRMAVTRAGMALQLLGGGATLWLLSRASGEPLGNGSAGISTASLVALAYLVLFGTVLGWSAYAWLLRHAPIQQVMTYAYVNPLVALTLGVLVRGEPVSPTVLIAAATIAGAVALVVRSAAAAGCRSGAR